MNSEDAELVIQAQRGNREAFERLVHKYTRLAGAIAYNVVGDFHAARDVVQEGFLKVYHSIGDLQKPDRFRSWFYGVMRSVAIDWVRKHRRRVLHLSQFADEVNLIPGRREENPEEQLKQKDLRQTILREIRDLPDSYREILILKYIEELSYQEIAGITGLTVSAIESRLHRARTILRKRFRKLSLP
jgi:RNA polymerase sigma-70 factor (ECF subfamily)